MKSTQAWLVLLTLSLATTASAQSQSSQWTDCAMENKTCNFNGTKLIRYGKNHAWNQGVYTDKVKCNNKTFNDPLVGTLKKCQYANAPANGFSQLVPPITANEPTASTANTPTSTISTTSTDPGAPTAPSDVAMNNLTCTQGTLSWAAASNSAQVANYDVYYDGQFLQRVAGTDLSAKLALSPGMDWGFYVNSIDAAGNVSQPSATLQVQIPNCENDTLAPSIATDLTGSASGNSVVLNWQAADDNTAVIAYQVFRDNQLVGETQDLTFVDSGLNSNESYSYSIAAKDAQDNLSAQTNPIDITTESSCSTAICAVDEIVSEKDIPWGLATLSDGSILYSQRDAHNIIRLNNGKKTIIGKVPNVQSTNGEGGLLGLAVTPDFPERDNWIYVFHTSANDNRLVRIRYVNNALDTSSVQVLLKGIGRNKFHNGGRLRFGPDNKLYVATGDAQEESSAQDIDSLQGKVLRINTDGSVPADNPYNNYVWSYGHRNPQGLAFDDKGQLWQQEFGNSELDETNLIKKGGNYGWPDCEATSSRLNQGCSTAGFIAPKQTYQTVKGSCSGIAIVKQALYVACLRGQRMYRVDIANNNLENAQEIFVGTYGRIRTVEPSIDGGLWMTTSNGGDKDSTPNNSDNSIYKIKVGN